MKICELNINKGEKKQDFISVYNTDVKLPVTIISGKNEGETILITAGIHCTEYVALQSLIEVANELKPENITGNIILVHAVNITGFNESNNNSSVPEDKKNLNRVFPGNKKGSLSEQIAEFMVNEVLSKSNYYIDMHGGDVHESLSPYVYYVGGADKNIVNQAKQIADMVDVDYKVSSMITSKGAYNHAGEMGIPSILIERGCSGVWSKEEVSLYKKDILNILRGLNFLNDSDEFKSYSPKNIKEAVYYTASIAGCWYPEKKSGDIVEIGEFLGIIKDFFGNECEKIYSDFAGVILYQRCSLSVKNTNEIVALGKL